MNPKQRVFSGSKEQQNNVIILPCKKPEFRQTTFKMLTP